MDHVLFFLASRSAGRAAQVEAALDDARRRAGLASLTRLSFETSVPRALARLRAGGFDGLVVDVRRDQDAAPPSHAGIGSEPQGPGIELLRGLFSEGSFPSVGRARTWMVVDREDEEGVAFAHFAGRMHLAGAVAANDEEAGWDNVLRAVERSARSRRVGRIALCLAGGGIEGIFYELGVLRAVQAFLPEQKIGELDILCGISAGSVVAALLANGLTPAEISDGLVRGSDKLGRMRRRDLFDPNVGELARRTVSLSRQVAKRRISPMQGLFRLPPSGLFAGKRLQDYMARELAKPGFTDDFRALGNRLLIGATDQDSSAHVVFGGKGWEHVPIHEAVRASAALSPFYAPSQILGRYYVDGGYSRTTNMRVAVQYGATLVLLVDPLVPMEAESPGHVAARGAIYGAMQGLKSLIHSRFDKATITLREMYPDVAFHLFQPMAGTLRVMAGSPMKFFYRPELEAMAYEETMKQLRGLRGAAMSRDFARHGVFFGETLPTRAPIDSVLEMMGVA
jgi:NTE family protein